MSKTSKNSSLDTINIPSNWDDNAFVDWISNNKQYLIWGIAVLFAGLILAYRLLSWNTISTEEDYYRAQNIFNKFQEDISENQAELTDLETIMLRHPELQSKYDGALAQTLLIEGDISQAKAFAEMTFKRTRSDNLSLFSDYSKTSFLIGNGQYSDALQQAKSLKENIESSGLTDTNLYAFNAIRIALLNEELGNKNEELAAWTVVQKLEKNSSAAQESIALFNSGSTNLNQYIESRR